MTKETETPEFREYVATTCEYVLEWYRKAWWRHSLPKWYWGRKTRAMNTKSMSTGREASVKALQVALRVGFTSEEVDAEKHPLFRMVLALVDKDRDRYLSDTEELENLLVFMISIDIAREIG